ncbi:hypothetical protein [Bacillus rubiinfantis]|uniref:hypothetical protein n=1 Tax=Bacillus rubiinfantis TaxID=1499680 RepID=UPI0005A7B746|nr:hypothetical protein [Bacillus rubiinfantis]
MIAKQEEMFMELRQTKADLLKALKVRQKNDWLTDILQEELDDVETALAKIQSGQFGQCEISGELIPEQLLTMLPTIKSVKDSNTLATFYKKPLQPPFLSP